MKGKRAKGMYIYIYIRIWDWGVCSDGRRGGKKVKRAGSQKTVGEGSVGPRAFALPFTVTT